MNFQKILPEQLKVGMRVVVAEPFYYGWHSRTGLTRYRYYTISRITPKRTKIICNDNEFLIKDTIFYVPHEEMSLENRRTDAFIRIQKLIHELENTVPTRFIGTVDEMENCVKIAEELLACRKECKNNSR